jgi:hypothetical protein
MALAATATLCMPAAAETMFTAQATMTLEYNDNLRFSPRNGREDWQRAAYARGVLAIVRPDDSLTFSPAVRVRRYQDDTVLDNDDLFLDLAAQRGFERSTVDLRASWHRDAALTSEFDGVALVEVGVERESWSVQPSWAYELTPSAKTKLGFSHNEVGYEERAVRQVDYEVDAASWSLIREISEGAQSSITLSASRLEAPLISNRADQFGLTYDYSRPLSETLSLSVTLGARRSKFAQMFRPERGDSGMLFGFVLSGERERGNWSVSLSRSVDPSGTGTVVQTDSLTSTAMHEWTPSLVSHLHLVVSSGSDLQGIDPGGDREYGQLRLGLSWNFLPRWGLAADYRLVGQRFEADDMGAVSNAVTITLTWSSEGAE